jgi:multiple sugar transport system permease protein
LPAQEDVLATSWNRRWYKKLLIIKWEPIILLTPAIGALLILTIYPLVYGLRLSLIDYDLLSAIATGEWNWFQNYIDLFQSKEFWHAVKITFQYLFLAVGLEFLLGMSLAILLSQKLPGVNLARTVIISAMVMTPVIVGTAWRLMYNPGWGLINYILAKLGIGEFPFLSETSTVLYALVVVDVWQWTPLVMLILLAGLQSMPVEPFEAALVDGASQPQIFWHLTLPLLKPAISIALLIRTMDCFRTFDIIYAMTGGGPGTASQNIMLLSYYTGLEFFHISAATAMAVVSLVMITILCILIIRMFGVELWHSQR